VFNARGCREPSCGPEEIGLPSSFRRLPRLFRLAGFGSAFATVCSSWDQRRRSRCRLLLRLWIMIDGLRIRSAANWSKAAVVDASRRALRSFQSVRRSYGQVERRVVASDQLVHAADFGSCL